MRTSTTEVLFSSPLSAGFSELSVFCDGLKVLSLSLTYAINSLLGAMSIARCTSNTMLEIKTRGIKKRTTLEKAEINLKIEQLIEGYSLGGDSSGGECRHSNRTLDLS